MKIEPTLEQLVAVFGEAPIPPEGYKWEIERSDCYEHDWVSASVNEWVHCPEFRLKAVKVAQPTTLSDLLGEDYQKTAYLNGDAVETFALEISGGQVFDTNRGMFQCMRDEGTRWSNSPFTTYEDANEFTEGGANE